MSTQDIQEELQSEFRHMCTKTKLGLRRRAILVFRYVKKKLKKE